MVRFFSRSGGERRRRKAKPVPPQRRPVRLSLEILEDRITPADITWMASGGTKAAPVAWGAALWTPLTPPPPGQVLPDSQDNVLIGNPTTGAPGFITIPSGTTEDVAGVTVTGTGGSTLTVAPNGELVTDPNGNTAGFTGAVSSASGGALFNSGTIKIYGQGPGLLAGSTTISGELSLQSGGTAGANETSTGATTIASGGNIDSYGLSVFNIANTKSNPFTIASGGTIDQNAIGTINVSGALSVLGSVNDLGQLDITPPTFLAALSGTSPGANIFGPGILETSGPADWSGGTLDLTGAFDVGPTSMFQTKRVVHQERSRPLPEQQCRHELRGDGHRHRGRRRGGHPGQHRRQRPHAQHQRGGHQRQQFLPQRRRNLCQRRDRRRHWSDQQYRSEPNRRERQHHFVLGRR